MELVLQQKQTLNLVMTTELRQAIELLQYSTYDLLQFIQEQAEENPFMELVDKDYDSSFINRRNTSMRSPDSAIDPLDFIATEDNDMREQLVEQLKWLDLDSRLNKVIHYLIFNLSENGYIMLSRDEISLHLGIDETDVQKAIHTLQRLEPIGIGARNLAECLLIQAKEKYANDVVLHSIIQNHLEDLANRKWKYIAKHLNVTLGEVKEAYERIQTLNPKPATLISNPDIEYLNPDIVVKLDEDSLNFQVYLNDSYVPEVRFDRDYTNQLASLEHERVAHYINDHFRRYQWLQNSIEQRRATILKIMNVLLIEQENFFYDGLKAVKPLTLKEVADLIDMHESTVSRAIANKVVQTPHGSYELRRLFSTKLAMSSGENASQTTVKLLLQDVINSEDKYKPLSDQKIADQLLKEKEIKISRRTVAKYRSELSIPSSSRRKEIKV